MWQDREGGVKKEDHRSERIKRQGAVLLISLLLQFAVGAGSPPASIHRFDTQDLGTCEMCHSASGPDTSSDFCLQCHDDTIAAGVHVNRAVLGTGNPYGIHPVGIRLLPGSELRIPDPGTDIRLFGPRGDTVECLSCHFAHDRGRGMTVPHIIGGRDYCLQCHIR